MNQKGLDGLFYEKVCNNCSKPFIISQGWLYKLKTDKKVKYYCSYNCWRKCGGDNAKYTQH